MFNTPIANHNSIFTPTINSRTLKQEKWKRKLINPVSWNFKTARNHKHLKNELRWEISHLKDKASPQFIFWLAHNEKLDNNTPFFLIRFNIIIHFLFFSLLNIFHLLENRILHCSGYWETVVHILFPIYNHCSFTSLINAVDKA